MNSRIRICDFSRSYQDAAAQLVNTGLGEHFGFIDPTMNPDLYDIGDSYELGDFGAAR